MCDQLPLLRFLKNIPNPPITHAGLTPHYGRASKTEHSQLCGSRTNRINRNNPLRRAFESVIFNIFLLLLLVAENVILVEQESKAISADWHNPTGDTDLDCNFLQNANAYWQVRSHAKLQKHQQHRNIIDKSSKMAVLYTLQSPDENGLDQIQRHIWLAIRESLIHTVSATQTLAELLFNWIRI